MGKNTIGYGRRFCQLSSFETASAYQSSLVAAGRNFRRIVIKCRPLDRGAAHRFCARTLATSVFLQRETLGTVSDAVSDMSRAYFMFAGHITP